MNLRNLKIPPAVKSIDPPPGPGRVALEGLGARDVRVDYQTGRVELEYPGEFLYEAAAHAIQDKIILPLLRSLLGKMFKEGG